jgi:hypothetical protein
MRGIIQVQTIFKMLTCFVAVAQYTLKAAVMVTFHLPTLIHHNHLIPHLGRTETIQVANKICFLTGQK